MFYLRGCDCAVERRLLRLVILVQERDQLGQVDGFGEVAISPRGK